MIFFYFLLFSLTILMKTQKNIGKENYENRKENSKNKYELFILSEHQKNQIKEFHSDFYVSLDCIDSKLNTIS